MDLVLVLWGCDLLKSKTDSVVHDEPQKDEKDTDAGILKFAFLFIVLAI